LGYRARVRCWLLLLFACAAPREDTSAPAVVSPLTAGESGAPADATTYADTGPGDTAPAAPPLVIVVLADDLGEDLLWAMPVLQERLLPDAAHFTRAYATAPLCCPSRASLLSGGFYPRDTGVLANEGTNGGMGLFRDTNTLATRLQAAGFTTAILGKYLNGYQEFAPYVPPGWDLFLAQSWLGDSTNSLLIRGASAPDAASTGVGTDTGGAHLTGWLFDEALTFLDAHPDEPTFLLVAPQSPHTFGSAAAEDFDTWTDRLRPASFAEADVSDKPPWIQARAPADADIAAWDASTKRLMENLASLDRGVGAFLDGLEARGLLDRATFVFTSDNGVLRGEHRLSDKGLPYEEAVRVPFVVRAPGVAPREDDRLVAMNLDLPATVAALAGLPPVGDGADLTAALRDPTLPLRDHVYLETSIGNHPAWSSVVTERWKYTVWASGETELYDLTADPAELESLHARAPADADVAGLAGLLTEHRALAVTVLELPAATYGAPYSTMLAAWGGTPPLSWTLEEGALPAGMRFDADGTLSGTPTEFGAFLLGIRVTDSGTSPFTGAPGTFASALRLTVGTALRADSVRDGDTLAFVVPAEKGARVHVRLFLDDTRDSPPLLSRVVTAGEDGLAHPRIPADPTRFWYWDAVVDGRVYPGGTVPPGRD
jgi:arylsulfatase A-like enzyme